MSDGEGRCDCSVGLRIVMKAKFGRHTRRMSHTLRIARDGPDTPGGQSGTEPVGDTTSPSFALQAQGDPLCRVDRPRGPQERATYGDACAWGRL